MAATLATCRTVAGPVAKQTGKGWVSCKCIVNPINIPWGAKFYTKPLHYAIAASLAVSVLNVVDVVVKLKDLWGANSFTDLPHLILKVTPSQPLKLYYMPMVIPIVNHHLIVPPNFPRSPAAALQAILATCATHCGT